MWTLRLRSGFYILCSASCHLSAMHRSTPGEQRWPWRHENSSCFWPRQKNCHRLWSSAAWRNGAEVLVKPLSRPVSTCHTVNISTLRVCNSFLWLVTFHNIPNILRRHFLIFFSLHGHPRGFCTVYFSLDIWDSRGWTWSEMSGQTHGVKHLDTKFDNHHVWEERTGNIPLSRHQYIPTTLQAALLQIWESMHSRVYEFISLRCMCVHDSP